MWLRALLLCSLILVGCSDSDKSQRPKSQQPPQEDMPADQGSSPQDPLVDFLKRHFSVPQKVYIDPLEAHYSCGMKLASKWREDFPQEPTKLQEVVELGLLLLDTQLCLLTDNLNTQENENETN